MSPKLSCFIKSDKTEYSSFLRTQVSRYRGWLSGCNTLPCAEWYSLLDTFEASFIHSTVLTEHRIYEKCCLDPGNTDQGKGGVLVPFWKDPAFQQGGGQVHKHLEGRMWSPNRRTKKDHLIQPSFKMSPREGKGLAQGHTQRVTGGARGSFHTPYPVLFLCIKNRFEFNFWTGLQSHTWDWAKPKGAAEIPLLTHFRTLASKNVRSRRDPKDHLTLWLIIIIKRTHHPRATKSESGGWMSSLLLSALKVLIRSSLGH